MNRVMTSSSTVLCDLFSGCAGCQIRSGVRTPPVFFEMKEFFSKREVDFSIHSGPTIGWRNRAKLAVRGTSGKPLIGLFKKGSHDVLSIPNCPMHHHLINKAVKIVERAMVEAKTPPYDEARSIGLIRYLQFVVEETSNTVQLTVVVFSEEMDGILKKFLEMIEKDPLWHSIWINFHPKKNNLVFGGSWHRHTGDEFVLQQSMGMDFYLHPGSFSQAHVSMFRKMLHAISEKVLTDKQVVECYAGSGMIGFHVAGKSKNVICTDNNPFSERSFYKTLSSLSSQTKEKISYHLADTKDASFLVGKADVVIVDPPRKGIDPLLLDALGRSSVKQLIYVSCHFMSCRSDVEKLEKSGWEVKSAEGYLFFPGTDHLETLCILERP